MYTERDELSDIISDTFKDINGFRPRHINYQTTPIEELRAIADRLSVELDELYEEQYLAQHNSDWDEAHTIAVTLNNLGINYATYERWLEEAGVESPDSDRYVLL